jgi:RND superfamily putative drug exporter
VGLALAIAMDATLVRGALAPAFMRLAGDLNWWAPGPLRRLHDRIGIAESVPEPTPTGDLAERHAVPKSTRPLVGAEGERP